MRSGNLDRRITIQRKSVTQSNSGEEVVTWADVATVWAEKIEKPGREGDTQSQIVGHAVKLFRIRWSTDVKEITSEHRLIFDGRTFDITDVQESDGRHRGLDLYAYAPSEQPVAP